MSVVCALLVLYCTYLFVDVFHMANLAIEKNKHNFIIEQLIAR